MTLIGQKRTTIKLRKGTLSHYGYKGVKDLTPLTRHRTLLKAIRSGEPPLGLYRRLNALMVLFRYKDPKLAMIFKKDRDYIGKKYGYGV